MSYSKFIQGIKNGAISSLSSGLICQPFQVVSTNMMVSYKHGKPISMLSTIKMIIQNEGLRGFYRGFKPATLKNIFGSAIYFACLEALKPKVKSNITSNPNFVNFISAAISRTIQMISVAPIYVMKTRFEVSGFNKYSGIFDAVRKIKQEEGYSGFFRGLSTTLIKEVPYSALFYTTFDFTKKTLKKDEMIKLLNTNKIDLFECIDFLGFTRKDLKDIFFATDKMIKKMQDTEFIKIKKTLRVEVPSAIGKVNMYLYDIETIYKITMQKYDKWLKENNYI